MSWLKPPPWSPGTLSLKAQTSASCASTTQGATPSLGCLCMCGSGQVGLEGLTTRPLGIILASSWSDLPDTLTKAGRAAPLRSSVLCQKATMRGRGVGAPLAQWGRGAVLQMGCSGAGAWERRCSMGLEPPHAFHLGARL